MTIKASSLDLATALNQFAHATSDNAAEAALGWTGGLVVNEEIHEVDAAATAGDTVAFKSGYAVRLSEGRWAPADFEEWSEDGRGVSRDNRVVYVWDHGHSEETTCETVDAAKAKFNSTVTELEELIDFLAQNG